jgi:glycosyltransferase 2 family protein
MTYIAGFAFTLSPGKIGEMVRSRYYQKIGIPLSSTAAAFFIERLMDLLAMLTLAFIALASSSAYDALIWGSAVMISLLLAVFAVSPWVKVSEYVEMAPWFPESLKKAVQGILRTLLSAKALLQPQLLAAGFIIGLIAWGVEGTGLMVIGAISPSISIDWATAIGIYSIAIIVGAISFLPGGLGSTEAVMIALLVAHSYSMPDAILLTMVCRLLTLWFAVVIGWMAVAALRRDPMLEKVSQ